MKIIIIPNAPHMTARHYQLALTLMEKGHQVHYLRWELPYGLNSKELVNHLFTSLLPSTHENNGIVVYKAIRLPFFWPVINGWIFKVQLKRLYKSIDADIIFTESYTNETEVPKSLPFIYDLADDYAAPAEVFDSKLHRIAFKLLDVKGVMRRQAENALAVTVVSELLMSYAKKYNSSVVKVPNGVSSSVIKNSLRSVTSKPNPRSIVYASGFGVWSCVLDVMTAVTMLHKEYPDVSLSLIGRGTEVPNILAYIKDNNAESYIHYLGFISDQEVLFEELTHHEIGLNISVKNKWRDAAHPMKLMDYSALGLKVLSSNLEEVKYLNLANVTICDAQADSIHKALKNIFDAPLDSQRYELVSQNVLKNYDWNVLGDKLVSLMQTSLKRGQEPS